MDAEAFIEILRTRRSIRRYDERVPERVIIERIIEAACWAPSNHNRQGWKFIVFENRPQVRALAERIRQHVREAVGRSNRIAAGQADEIVHYAGAFEAAPVVILAMHKCIPAVGRELLDHAATPLASGEAISTAMAVQNLCLAAHALGLGTCVMTAPLLAGAVWAGLPDLPAGFEPTCLVTVGYPADQPEPPRRKDLKHVVEYR
jgi:nitroreductase